MPQHWETSRPGWTRYDVDGTVSRVDNLNGETLVSFDVETLYKLSPYPVMATAASVNAWYSWLSPSIFDRPPAKEPEPQQVWDKSVPECYPHDLIPLFEGNTSPAIVVGHNVGYDRARIKEEYSTERTTTRFLDTLSLHVATRGITSVQRPPWLKYRKNKKEQQTMDQEAREAFLDIAHETGDDLLRQSIAEWTESLNVDEGQVNTWKDTTAANSLADVAQLYCGTQMDKSTRDRFGDETIRHASELIPELDSLLDYCASDVKITHDVYKKVLPIFLAACPHPASFAGILTMGNSFLPVEKSWTDYLRNAETIYQKLLKDVGKSLRVLADKLRQDGPQPDDPWASQLDWTPKSARWPDKDAHVASASKKQAKLPLPHWYTELESAEPLSLQYKRKILPLILKCSYRGYPLFHLRDHFWCFKVPVMEMQAFIEEHGPPVELSEKQRELEPHLDESVFFRVSKVGASRTASVLGSAALKTSLITSAYPKVLAKIEEEGVDEALPDIVKCAKKMFKEKKQGETNDWMDQLDSAVLQASRSQPSKFPRFGMWPQWYWELTKPPTSKEVAFGELDLTMRKNVAPLLLKMRWRGFPLARSRQHKWIYRVPLEDVSQDDTSPIHESKAVQFSHEADEQFANDTEHMYFRIPHKDGDEHNVGNPLSRMYIKSVESGELSSELANDPDERLASAAKNATNMNALCSYWISARERIMNQMVVYDDSGRGMILPQVITMGTVTRRAVEATWLTASNAKKNRVGSELKAMVRAPSGYVFVGADVDSEELWLSSVMGDSQFGMHGATAIGWMTLEGTKSAGTDLHSKTANILSISRDAAKVFNYSRIYGAGKKHAVQLLLQGGGNLTTETADKLAAELYKQTKGAKTFRARELPPADKQYIWHGGSESYLFNTLETIALMERPTTPALGCGVTRALRKSFLDSGQSYLPSRVNWTIQSSGVDYLHLLITSMEYLIKRYGIQARYLISVHDEVRYLVKEGDEHRTALAMQIANIWTRALVCFNLGLDDIPQGVAFFSAVDIDRVLRKETDMPCVTPSHPTPLEPGESHDIVQTLEQTGGVLGAVVDDTDVPQLALDPGPPVRLFEDLNSPSHARFLSAQAQDKSRFARMYVNSLPASGEDDRPEIPLAVAREPFAPVTDPKHYSHEDHLDDLIYAYGAHPAPTLGIST